jgi:hypothetical protein
VLQEDENKKWDRSLKALELGAISVNEWREMVNIPAVQGPEADTVGKAEPPPVPEPVPPESTGDRAAQNGNGKPPPAPAAKALALVALDDDGELYLKHLPGRHEQKRHGNRYGGGAAGRTDEKPAGGGAAPEASANLEPTFERATPEETSAYLSESAQQWRKTLNREQLGAVQDYTEGEYERINRDLRKGKTPKETKLIEQTMIKADQPLQVYRGLEVPALTKAFDDGNIVGTVLNDKGFVSTSYNAKEAKTMAGKDGIQMNIHVPKGAKFAPVSGVARIPGEKEALLNRNAAFKVLGARKVDGVRVLDVELVP